MNQLVLSYPEVPGHKRQDTSAAAAMAMESSAGTIRSRCLRCLDGRDLTADEVADILNLSILTVRPRMTELLRMGKIEDSGLRRFNASGKKAIVWKKV